MRLRALTRRVLPTLICVFLCPKNARAQSSPAPGPGCAPTVSCDEPARRGNEKVFPKIIIDDISFDGPVHLAPADLDQLTKRLTSIEINGEIDWLHIVEWLDVAPAWLDHGYYNVQVTGRAIPRGDDGARGHFSVVFHVDEGFVYRMGDITFRSWYRDVPLVFSAQELRNSVPWRNGDLFSAAMVREGIDALNKLYGSKGYVDLNLTPETKVDEDRRQISIDFLLNQHRQYRIRRVAVCGSNPDFENLLKSEIKPGNVFDSPRIRGFFEKNKWELGPHLGEENVQYERDANIGAVDITVSLRNCPGPHG